MDEKELNELETMRKDLNKMEIDIQNEEDYISMLNSSKVIIADELRKALHNKEKSYLKDKKTIEAFDEEHNTSNKDQRMAKIEELTVKERTTFNKFVEESTRAIRIYEKELQIKKQKLKDFKRRYSNLKAFYKSKQPELIVVDPSYFAEIKKVEGGV